MMNRWQPPRLLIRLACLALAILLLWPLALGIQCSAIAVQASPFIAICTIVAGGAFGPGILLGMFIAAMVLFRKRWFCRYICPVGLLLDGASSIGRHKRSWWRKFPSIGRYIVLLTVAGSAIGYPLLLWMDPLAFFSSAMTVRTATGLLPGVLAAAGLMILFFTAFASGDFWCARICPLGATQDLLAGAGNFIGHCRESLKAKTPEETGGRDAFPTTRRAFIAIAAGVGVGIWAERIGRARTVVAPLRPPGSVGEEDFTGLCVRCGNCIRACPSKIIHPDTGQAGIAGLLAPVIRYKREYCLEQCHACTQVCPSGALRDLNLDQKNRHVIGEAILDASLCFLVRGVNDCDICVRSCPFDAVEVYWNEDLYVAYPVVDPEKCNGCGACEVYCPTGEIKAINVFKSIPA